MIASFFVYTLFLVSLIDTKPAPTLIHCLTWTLAWIMEVILLGCSLASYLQPHHQKSVMLSSDGPRSDGMTDWEGWEIAVNIVRLVLLTVVIVAYAAFSLQRRREDARWRRWERGSSEERRGLLNGDAEANRNGDLSNGHAYGSLPQEHPRSGGHEKEAWSRPDKVPSKSWWEYVRGYSLFFPYLWPAKSRQLQLTVVACFVLVLLARVVNLLVPFQVGEITNRLAGEDGDETQVPWGGICLYIFYRLLQGNNGLLGALRGTLWVPISQYSYRELSTAAFEHVHGLSLDFHLGKKTGEVLSALGKGNSINTFLEQVTFQVVPMLIDLGIAIGYFLIKFDAYYALVIAIVTFAYLYLTIRLAQWRADIRREMVNFSRQEDAVK